MKKYFPLLAKICLLSVYIIILAGSTVRMTGSGMGCPDWPKCFGHLIPPTSEEELLWQPNKEFKKGIVIIKDETLLVARSKFTTTSIFNSQNWKAYTKHDYAKFNVVHTWVEYVNRLATAVSGIFFLLLIIASLGYFKTNKKLTILSFLTLFLMLFEAWLGKTVVDSNLSVSKITIHMLVALLIAALLLVIVFETKKTQITFKKNKLFNTLLIVSFGLTLLQIVLGIDIREFVDVQLKSFGFENKQFLKLEENTKFLIHRSFSVVVVIVNLWLFFRNRKLNLGFTLQNVVLLLLSIEILAGVLMYYFNFPFGTQVIHLLFAAILFGVQFYLILQSRNSKIEN